jgi:hypothetical protein
MIVPPATDSQTESIGKLLSIPCYICGLPDSKVNAPPAEAGGFE